MKLLMDISSLEPINRITMGRDTILQDTILQDTILQDTILQDTILRDTNLRDTTLRDTNSRDIAHGAMYRGDIGDLGDILGPGDSVGIGASQTGWLHNSRWYDKGAIHRPFRQIFCWGSLEGSDLHKDASLGPSPFCFWPGPEASFFCWLRWLAFVIITFLITSGYALIREPKPI
jgi:hypothetical protein